MFGIRRHASALVAALLLGLGVAVPQVSLAADAFTITAPLAGHAVTSCSDVTMSGGTIDSAGVSSPSPANKGTVATNGNITLSGSSTIQGDATVGPGKRITTSGSAHVTGISSAATSTFDCKPIDLVALKTTLQSSNDNARIPQTGQHKNPLTGASHTDFVMSGADTLTLPAGTYYFTSFVVSGSSVITVTGPAHILCSGTVSMSGTSAITGTTSYNLHFWISGASVALSGATIKGFLYAPSASVSLASATLAGSIFANSVTLSGSSHLTRTIDDVAPRVAIISPADNSGTSNPAHVLVKGTVADDQTDVSVNVNGQPAATASDGTWQITLDLSVAASPVTVSVVATDAAGNTATASIHVVTAPPAISLTSPLPGASLATRTVSLSGAAGTATSLTVNGTPATIAGGVWSLAGFDLGPDGAHTLTIVGTNSAGATTITPIVTDDTTPPTVTAVVVPAPNAFGWNRSAPTVSFTCSDTTSGVATCPAPVTVAVETASQAVGGTAADKVGNQKSALVTVKLDTTAPLVAITTPANGTSVNSSSLSVSGTVSDALSGIGSVTCNGSLAIVNGGTFTCTVILVAGDNTLTAIATDIAGNSATSTRQVTLGSDHEPPHVTISSPLDGGTSKTPTISVAGTATDDVAVASVTVNGQQAALSGNAWTTTFTFAAVNGSLDGPRNITAVATDTSGKQASATVTVVIDGTPPGIIVTLAPPANAAGWNHQDITATFTCTDPASGIAICPVPITLSTETASQSLTGTATDKAGNTASAAVTVKLDKTAPAVTIDMSDPRTIVYDPHVTISGSVADALSGVASVTCDGVAATLTPSSFQCAVILPMGPHDVAVAAADIAGNITTATRTYTLQADTQPPLIVGFPSQPVTASGWANQSVTVSFFCADGETSVASCSAPVFLTAEGAGQTATGTAVDAAGNSASTTVTIGIDKTAPTLSVDPLPAAPTKAPQVTLTGAAADTLSGLDTLTCNGVAATLTSGHFTCDVPLLTGLNDIVVEALDRAGNRSSVTLSARVDVAPPSIVIAAPSNAFVTGGTAVAVNGTVQDDDDQVASVVVNGVAASLSADQFSAVVPLIDGANTVSVVATDRAGNSSTAAVTVNRVLVPTITISAPADLLVTSSVTIDVSGSVPDPAATVRVNDIAATVTGNSFVAHAVPLAQGRTVITAVASANGTAATTSINVFRDAIPPRAVLYYPVDGAVVSQSPIAVTGMVDDIVVGTINAGQVSVTVNGVPAQVMNRAFTAFGIDLTPGLNTIVITAIDQGHNTIGLTSHVTYDTGSAANRLAVVSGDGQTAGIGTALPAPLVVRLTGNGGTPLAGSAVAFKVIENNGMLTAGVLTGRSVTVTTDAQGQASVAWTLGTRAGAGNQRVAVSTSGVTATTEFVAIGTPGAPALVVVDSGSEQYGAVGGELARPIVAVVVDRGSNRLPNIPVTFSIVRGGGSFAGQPTVTVTTDSDGRAIVRPTLGPNVGADNNVFLAMAPDVTGSASFRASGLIPGNPADTTITGVVLDNSDIPIAGVSIRIDGTALVAQTDGQGLFTLANVPVGYVKLFVDGSTAQRPGTWPTIEYAMYTVPGQKNTLGMPIYLLPIDVTRGLFVDETHGGTLTLSELPGFALTVTAGSATFPGGSRTGTVSVTLVHADKMPMPPGFGQQPRFIVTIQPPGVHFDPPAAMSLPNVDGLAPGEITEMYSFDHDLGQFVAIGTGSVSEDGSVIKSDPGVGIIKGGWHCGGNPAASGTSSECGVCSECNGTECVAAVAVKIGFNADPYRNKYVDHDDPTRTFLDANTLPAQQPLYANSHDHVGDMVRYAAYITIPSMRSRVKEYKWTAVGPSPDTTLLSGPQGPNEQIWNIFNLDWKPGRYQIRLDVTFTTGCIAFTTYSQRVGIRTDDYILYGSILQNDESETFISPVTRDRYACPVAVVHAIEGNQGAFNDPNSNAFVPDNASDRLWVVEHMLNLTKDDTPSPTDLTHPFEEPTGQPYKVFGLSARTGFRQAVHAQFKYLVDGDGTIVMPPTAIGEVFSKTGATPAPCFGIPWSYGVESDLNGKVKPLNGNKAFGYIMLIQGGSHIADGNHQLLRRELSWVFFRLRFDGIDGTVKSDLTHSTDSWQPDENDPNDFSAAPTFFLYRRFYAGGVYNAELMPQFPIQPDFRKFLSIAPRWSGAPAGAPSYP